MSALRTAALLGLVLLIASCGGGGGGRSPGDAAEREARAQLDGRDGAVVAIEVPSGRVLLSHGSGETDPVRTLFAPGSTLKALLAGAALDAGVVTPATRLDSNRPPFRGVRNFGGAQLGPLTVADALVVSSNVAFAHVAQRLGARRIEAVLRRAGWGEPLPFDRRSTPSLADVPSVAPGGRYRDPDITQRSTAGQLALLAAAIAGDGTVPSGRVWSPRTSAFLRAALRRAVVEGTGLSMADPELAIAAKTGTERRADGRIQASVIALAPADEPTVALAVTVVAGAGETGGTAAGPIARAVLRRLVP